MNGKYINKTHTYGKIWMLVTLCLFISVPALICVHLGVSPKINMIAKGLSTVALVFYPTAVLEVLTYSPLLGTGGAFQQVTPALFGSLCASYLAKHWKISILPIAVLSFILIFNGTLGTGVLIPIGVVVSVLGAFAMFKKGIVK